MEAQVTEETVMLSVFSLMVFAGVAVLWMAMSNRRAIREMEHRERLAMIESGVVPAPEADPLGFESQMEASMSGMSRQDRWRTAGTLTMGFGLALGMLLWFAGGNDIAIGVGGAFAVLGASFLLNGALISPETRTPRGLVRRPSVKPPNPTSSSPSPF
jgi:hypothetical protein